MSCKPAIQTAELYLTRKASHKECKEIWQKTTPLMLQLVLSCQGPGGAELWLKDAQFGAVTPVKLNI